MVTEVQVISALDCPVDIYSIYRSTSCHSKSFAFLQNQTSRDIVLLAKMRDQLLGHLVARHCVDWWDILDVYVCQGKRQQGIGYQLIRAMQRDARPARLMLEVAAHNTPAAALYTRSGFKQIGVRKNYYSNPQQDALCMLWKPKIGEVFI